MGEEPMLGESKAVMDETKGGVCGTGGMTTIVPEELTAEELEEEERVAKLLAESEAKEVGPTADEELQAPTLLRTGANDLVKATSVEAKQEQLQSLLSKAQQYSNFIVNSQMGMPGTTSTGKTEDGSSNKKRKRDDANKADLIAEAQGAMETKKKEGKTKLVEQPEIMTGGTLKGYQVEGLRWMATLYENGLSGILADEMGLGKTIQVIALVAHLRDKSVNGPIIIAAPLATLPNWTKEFKKWTPSINVLQYHGSKQWRAQQRREIMAVSRQQSRDFPVIVTSYEVCIMDRNALSKFRFSYLIVDEGQRVKNRNCRLVRELKKLETQNRILLSGTPIQNTLEELWSLLNFVNPDIFDDLRVFQSWFGFRNIGKETQVDDILDDEQHNRIVTKLHEILRPFLLRRVKADVLQNVLPPKKELVVYVPMSSIQRKYAEELDAGRLRDTLVASGVASGSSLSQQNLLMNHRKNANHPFLFGEPRASSGDYVTALNPRALSLASGKFAFLERLLPKLKADGHKVLIFSQMTELLNLLEDFLVQLMGYETFRIDGGVPLAERQRQIDEFNDEAVGENDKFVFMLSTRAGGLGINLASADTCIIFDSDWNPSQDSQAMDRCHRIGQTRKVVVYRLLTSGSVEIDMMEKQVSKKKLERMAIVGGDFKRAGQRSTTADLSVDHLRSLLADDVNMAQRLNQQDCSYDFAQPQISDDELHLILDRDKIFHPTDPIPPEGKMYDVVHDSGGAMPSLFNDSADQ